MKWLLVALVGVALAEAVFATLNFARPSLVRWAPLVRVGLAWLNCGAVLVCLGWFWSVGLGWIGDGAAISSLTTTTAAGVVTVVAVLSMAARVASASGFLGPGARGFLRGRSVRLGFPATRLAAVLLVVVAVFRADDVPDGGGAPLIFLMLIAILARGPEPIVDRSLSR